MLIVLNKKLTEQEIILTISCNILFLILYINTLFINNKLIQNLSSFQYHIITRNFINNIIYLLFNYYINKINIRKEYKIYIYIFYIKYIKHYIKHKI